MQCSNDNKGFNQKRGTFVVLTKGDTEAKCTVAAWEQGER